MRAALVWSALAIAIGVPLAIALTSPLLQWRSGIYIAASTAGVAGLGLLLVQPLLMAGYLPGLPARGIGRKVHRWVGATLVLAVVIHVVGLWITSPPDVIDALLFVSPTPFSIWGVIAMWALFATAGVAIARRRLRLRWITWRRIHLTLAVVIVGGTIVHAMLIEGTMGQLSKLSLCALVAIATAAAART